MTGSSFEDFFATAFGPYAVTWRAKGVGATEALAADVRTECIRLGRPEPRVESRRVAVPVPPGYERGNV
jgi:hypothetical protein